MNNKADFSGVSSRVDSTAQVLGQAGTPPVRNHTVAKGDTLSALAQHYLGKASAWPQIFEANRDVLKDPDRIQIGQVLKIPASAE